MSSRFVQFVDISSSCPESHWFKLFPAMFIDFVTIFMFWWEFEDWGRQSRIGGEGSRMGGVEDDRPH